MKKPCRGYSYFQSNCIQFSEITTTLNNFFLGTRRPKEAETGGFFLTNFAGKCEKNKDIIAKAFMDYITAKLCSGDVSCELTRLEVFTYHLFMLNTKHIGNLHFCIFVSRFTVALQTLIGKDAREDLLILSPRPLMPLICWQSMKQLSISCNNILKVKRNA